MDMMAIPLVLRLERYGHHTPSDYSIIGFDDSPYADTVNLTTMRQDPYAMGRAAAQKAMKLIEGGPLENAHEIVRAQLVLRGTDSVYGTIVTVCGIRFHEKNETICSDVFHDTPIGG